MELPDRNIIPQPTSGHREGKAGAYLGVRLSSRMSSTGSRRSRRTLQIRRIYETQIELIERGGTLETGFWAGAQSSGRQGELCAGALHKPAAPGVSEKPARLGQV